MPYNNKSNRAIQRYRAASRIQRAFRARRKLRNNRSFAGRVRTVIHNSEPYKYLIKTTEDATGAENPIQVGQTVTNLLAVNDIPFNTENIQQCRQSTKVLMKSLRLKLKIQANTDEYARVRLLLVRSKRSNNSALPASGFENMPTDANCFRRDDVSTFPNLGINCFPNQRYLDVVWDKTYQLGTFGAKVEDTAAPAGPYPLKVAGNSPFHSTIEVEKYWKLNKTCKFNAIASPAAGQQYAISPYNNMSYFLVAVTGSSATPHPQVYASMSLSFKDLD